MAVQHQFFRSLRILLILGRISNLPTVWSNCLAAWLLAGGGPWGRFIAVCAGATLLYSGGMFLNDAFDVDFDRQHRPERPIPSGHIGRRTVGILGGLWLALGWLALVPLGVAAMLFGLALAGTIVLYDAVHKGTLRAPLIMCACRFGLYLVAGAAVPKGINAPVLWGAAALAAYIAGLSYLARNGQERWPIALLFVPFFIALVAGPTPTETVWILAGLLGLWLVRCLYLGFLAETPDVSLGVSGLLAGIVLVDCLAAAQAGPGPGAAFAGLFLLALALQRTVPAT